MRFPAFLLLAWLAGPAFAADFKLAAGLSKEKVELGESFSLEIRFDVDGNFAFAPQLEAPPLEGFQILGQPRQSQNMQWVNGVIKAQVVLSWEMVALKSGRLKLGPFKATAKDPATGEITRQAPALYIEVLKPAGPVIPPTPMPDESLEEGAEELRGIKPDLGPPWARIATLAAGLLALAGLLAWLALRPAPVRRIEAVRDPGQVALLDLAKAEELLRRGEEEAYLRELSRILRFYLRHRLKVPEKEMTLLEAGRLMAQALRASGPATAGGPPGGSRTAGEPAAAGPRAAGRAPQDAGAEAGAQAAVSRLAELLFGGAKAEAAEFPALAGGIRAGIVALERGAKWSEPELFAAALDEAREKHGEGEPWFRAMKRALQAHLELLEEARGREAVERRLAKGLEDLGPAAAARIGALLRSRPLGGDFDLEKLDKDLKRLAPLLGAAHSKGVDDGK